VAGVAGVAGGPPGVAGVAWRDPRGGARHLEAVAGIGDPARLTLPPAKLGLRRRGHGADAPTASATPAAIKTRRHAQAAPKMTESTIGRSASPRRLFHMHLPPLLLLVHGGMRKWRESGSHCPR
jgi:hypothetical protein